MFKKNQPGFPCTPVLPPLLDAANYLSGQCIELSIFGLASGTCSCCADLNAPASKFYIGIFEAGRYHITDFGDICNGMQMITFGGIFATGPAADCHCYGGYNLPQFFPAAQFVCEESWFFFTIGNGVGSGGETLAFGWPYDSSIHGVTGADSDAAREAFRLLANGETATLPVHRPDFGVACDRTNAYATIKLVDCPEPPVVSADACGEIASACLDKSFESPGVTGWVTPGLLRFSGFEDCTRANPDRNSVEHWEWSVLNDILFELDYYRDASVITPTCSFDFSSPIADAYYLPTGTQFDYDDPGMLLRWDELELPVDEHTVELYVVGIIAVLRCWEGDPDSQNFNKLVLKAIGLQLQEYEIFNKGHGGQFVHPVSPYCDAFMAGIFNGLIWEDSDLRETGGVPLLGSTDTCFLFDAPTSLIEYSRCDTSAFFTATLRVGATP